MGRLGEYVKPFHTSKSRSSRSYSLGEMLKSDEYAKDGEGKRLVEKQQIGEM